jgi:glycerol-3-phosphate dehydrogenase subunit C
VEYRPSVPAYWDVDNLAGDVRQAFDICNGCRICHNLCPSFPELFRIVEGYGDDATQVTVDEMNRVAELCFQCKICFMKCPYTPPHRFDLDFPRLMLRAKAVRTRREGLSAADRFLGDPESSGALGSRWAPMSNWANRAPVFRRWLERRVGVDRRRRLPRFARVRFSRWARTRAAAPRPDVVIFSTCTVEYHEPGLGQAAVAVLEHQGLTVAVPEGQRCCGMPALDGGDLEGAVERARQNLKVLAPYAEQGIPIVVLQPTCSYVLREEYPRLVEGAVAETVAALSTDVTDFLHDLLRRGSLKQDFVRSGGPVLYHVACHARVRGGGPRGRKVLEAIPGTTVTAVEQCSGIDGTWGLKAAYYDASQAVAARLTEAVRAHPDHAVCSDCRLAALQIDEAAGRPTRHPVEMLAEAYGIAPGATTARGGGSDA